MEFLTVANLVLKYGPTVLGLINTTFTNKDLANGLNSNAGEIAGALTSIGASLFPKAAKEIQIVGGAIAAFDLNTTKWLQGALNNIDNAGLVVDGSYGPKTRDAVEAFQTKHNLRVDGLAGNVTRAAVNALLQNLPDLTPKAP